jgi:hypothetical protein
MQLPVLIALFAQIAGMSTPIDTQALINSALCIQQCLPQGMWMPALISLAQQIQSAGPASAQYGFITVHSSHTINIAVAGTYYPVVGYDDYNFLGFKVDLTNGKLICGVSGYYYISFNCSFVGPSPADSLDADLMVNGVVTEWIASHTTAASGAGKYVNLSASGIIHLNAGDYIQIALTDNNSTGNVTLIHAQLSATTP